MQSKFITFEGGEGSGKSTQSKLLHEYLTKKSIPSILTREPGGTPSAESIRNLLVTGDGNRWDKISETFLFYAARRDHVEKLIKPELANGKIVICDRFNDSTLAYQGYGHKLNLDIINQISNIAIGNFKPDITFIIDVPADVGLKRSNARLQNATSDESRFEKLDVEFHESLRQGFHSIASAEPERCKIINGLDSPEVIHQKILNILGYAPL